MLGIDSLIRSSSDRINRYGYVIDEGIIIDEVDGMIIDGSIEINEVDEAGKKATIVFRNLINNCNSVSAPLQLFDAQCSYSVRSAAIRCAAQLFDAQPFDA